MVAKYRFGRVLRGGLFVCLPLVIGASSTVACGSSDNKDESLPEGTGAVVAAISTVPDDVQCVEIMTSDWRSPYVRTDVSPGSSATIRIVPLSPGHVVLWGAAYAEPCMFFDAGVGIDGGHAGTLTQTWEATPVGTIVASGHTNHVQLTFRRFGSLDVEVDFEEPCCDPGAVDGGGPCACFDGGW